MKSSEYPTFLASLWLTLSLGSLLIERDHAAAVLALYPLLYLAALLVQSLVNADLPFHAAEAWTAAKEEQPEILFSGGFELSRAQRPEELDYLITVAGRALNLKIGASVLLPPSGSPPSSSTSRI